jgi:uncharacterized lipoprotein YajG
MKWRNGSLLTAVSVVVLLQGCLSPQTVHLAPKLEDHRSKVGVGKVVGLEVTDVRPQWKVGIVGDPKGKSVEISAEDDSTKGIYNATVQALRHMGFTVQPAAEAADRSLRIELRELEYQSLKLPFTFETKGKVTLAVFAQNGSDKYQRTFKASNASTSGTPPTVSDTDREVNELVSIALQDMIEDEQVMAVLTQAGG